MKFTKKLFTRSRTRGELLKNGRLRRAELERLEREDAEAEAATQAAAASATLDLPAPSRTGPQPALSVPFSRGPGTARTQTLEGSSAKKPRLSRGGAKGKDNFGNTPEEHVLLFSCHK